MSLNTAAPEISVDNGLTSDNHIHLVVPALVRYH